MIKKFLKISLFAALAAAVVLLLAAAVILRTDTGMPKLYFEGDISGMEDKKDIRSISVSYADGERDFEGFAEIKLQGTSSLAYKKKNYTIKLFRDGEHTDKLKVDMGWGEQNKYCLKANWIDKTHARNVVTARLVTQMQRRYGILSQAPRNGAIDGFPIEIYVNGRFHGIYTFNIPKDEWQFGMDGDNPDHIVIGGEGWDQSTLFMAAPNFESWEVEVGEASEETLEKMNRLFDFVISSSDEEFKENFEKHLDLDAALNYYVMSDVACLTDNRGKNMLIATYDGELWYLSLYDLDTSWGTNYNGKELLSYTRRIQLNANALFDRLEKLYGKELAERYFELREDVLSNENILSEFKSFEAEIPTLSFVKERLRWGPLLPGYSIEQIEEYLDASMAKKDLHYQTLLDEN